jgi:hypothetical protein
LTAAEFLFRLATMLDAAGIPHMLAGSFASAYHGTPRATQDIDLVIDPTPKALDAFVARVSDAGYYVDADRARAALEQRRQFNVVDAASGWKADLVVRKGRPFSREEFARRAPATVLGVDVFVASAEDTILAKLEWAARTDSERQLTDVAGILSVKGGSLDRAYIERWAQDLGVLGLWRRLAGPDQES